MTYVLAVAAAIAGAAAGFGLGLAAGVYLAPLLGISDFEGASGYFAGLIGLVAGLAGMIIAALMVLRRRGHRSFGAAAGRLALVVLSIAAAVAAGLALYAASDDVLNRNGAPPQLAFELRLPPGAQWPAPPPDLKVHLDTDKNRMPGQWRAGAIRRDSERAVLAGSVEMYHRTNRRLLVISLPGGKDAIFRIGLSAAAPHADAMGAWQAADQIAEGGKIRKPAASEAYELRYRPVWPGRD